MLDLKVFCNYPFLKFHQSSQLFPDFFSEIQSEQIQKNFTQNKNSKHFEYIGNKKNNY